MPGQTRPSIVDDAPRVYRPQLTYIVLLQHLACVHGSSSTQLHVHALCPVRCGAPRHETTTTGKPQPALHCTAAAPQQCLCVRQAPGPTASTSSCARGVLGVYVRQKIARAHIPWAMEVTGRRQCRTANAIVEQRIKKKRRRPKEDKDVPQTVER